MLLPVSVLGKIIYKEGIFVFAVFGGGLVLHSISVKKKFLYYTYSVQLAEFVFFARKSCIFL